MEYKVLYAESAEELEKLVNEYIREGFEPLGGVATGLYPLKGILMSLPLKYMQAVIKRD